MPEVQGVAGVVASQRWDRQIISRGVSVGVVGNAAGATTISVPWPTAAGTVAANTRTFLMVALKPGTAGLGSVVTPAGWTLIGSFLGGGYGAAIGVGTGDSWIFMFYKDADNSVAPGSPPVVVTLVPDGANGVATAVMSRIQKLSGAWQPIAFATGQATVDSNIGTFVPTPLIVCPGDALVYGFALTNQAVNMASLNAGTAADLAGFTPSLAGSGDDPLGYGVNIVISARRAKRGLAPLGTQILTKTSTLQICRGPMLVARVRVR